jgi:uncharacterized protein YjeT (DUF2065 family)
MATFSFSRSCQPSSPGRGRFTGYTDNMLRRNPAVAFAVGIVLLALGFLTPGTTREVILRAAGVLAILAGAVMWVMARRRG